MCQIYVGTEDHLLVRDSPGGEDGVKRDEARGSQETWGSASEKPCWPGFRK